MPDHFKEKCMYTIYCHIFPNGKRYIGLTKTSLQTRWDNGRSYKTCPLVNRAIDKYGWENICHEVLGTAPTKEKAEEMERMYIAKHKSNNPSYGYNILPGGDVATNALDDEMRKKLGNGWRGKHRTDEEKAKISAGVKEKFKRDSSNGHFGMKASDETRRKMSESHKKRWSDPEMRRIASERMKARHKNDKAYNDKVIGKLRESNQMRHDKTQRPF